jgi:pantoate--beta-alanine ligase
MGALHAGHLSLVERARKSCDRVVVSIFVNPMQFSASEDFSKYPRQEKQDLALLRRAGVHAVFLPSVQEMYGLSDATKIVPPASLTQILEGRFRPGHFEGVATVVQKLFQIVQPTHAFFGEKDFQQVRVVETMVEDLFLPIKIVRCKTVREKSGLAMSSRNKYLTDSERDKASILARTLRTAGSVAIAKKILRSAGFQIEYLEVWQRDLAQKNLGTKGRWLVAARFAGVRLIDNILRI